MAEAAYALTIASAEEIADGTATNEGVANEIDDGNTAAADDVAAAAAEAEPSSAVGDGTVPSEFVLLPPTS